MDNRGHLVRVVFGAMVGFGASFIFGDLLTLPLDLYYLIYFAIIILIHPKLAPVPTGSA